MDLEKFNLTIRELFGNELLELFHDDYGYTNTSNNDICKIGYATNLSIETIEQAAFHHIDLMITHHDAWDFVYGLKDACLKKLKEHNISHFWIHGPLDFVDFGTCTSLMNVIGVDKIVKYSVYDNGERPGIGEFSEPVQFNSLVERMRTELNEPVRAWRNNRKDIKRIGVLTGAGNSTDFIKMALMDGCDTYITGEATLYSIQYAQFAGINLIAGSHTFTEIFGVESLAKKVKERNNDIEIIKLEEEHFELNHS